MLANNETGIIQPIKEIADCLTGSKAKFHVDAAQGFGKSLPDLTHERIDLISVSGHKIYGPKGIGALIGRSKNSALRKLKPLQVGGGQERGLRAGTLPTPLIAGMGLAAELAEQENDERLRVCKEIEARLKNALTNLPLRYNGCADIKLPNVLNFSLQNIPSEAIILSMKEKYAFSNGSACTAATIEPSHVITAMQGADSAELACRISWDHNTSIDEVDFASCLAHALG
jgi:cysteine desulfurase